MNDWDLSKKLPYDYEVGSNGPNQAEELLSRDGRNWE